MSGADTTMPPDDWRDRLSALLDGELEPDEEARVRDLVAGSPEAQEELAALAQVRTWVRDLPAVDPPFGFYERLLRPVPAARHPRYIGAKVASAVAVAAAAIVLIVGITPAADSVVPPVVAYASRHLEMDPTAEPSSFTEPATEPMDFDPVPDDTLDAMGAPVVLTGEFHRMSGYKSDDGAMHLVYSDGNLMVSVYEQVGVVAWDRLPDGDMTEVGGSPAWMMAGDAEEVMVLERGTMVYTVVAQRVGGAHDEMVEMAVELPAAADPSMVDRFAGTCRSVAARFSMGTSEP